VPTTPEQRITSFLTDVSNKNAAITANQFSVDNGATPVVGVSYDAQAVGPTFVNRAGIMVLFAELFRCFDQLELQDIGASHVQAPPNAAAPNEIGLQAELFGRHIHHWGHGANPDARLNSRPLVNIPISNRSLTDGNGHGLPTFALFTFDGTQDNKIVRLALYLDRFKFVERLGNEV
jgi:hypothetical protein